jgi:hypothetical protein
MKRTTRTTRKRTRTNRKRTRGGERQPARVINLTRNVPAVNTPEVSVAESFIRAKFYVKNGYEEQKMDDFSVHTIKAIQRALLEQFQLEQDDGNNMLDMHISGEPPFWFQAPFYVVFPTDEFRETYVGKGRIPLHGVQPAFEVEFLYEYQ